MTFGPVPIPIFSSLLDVSFYFPSTDITVTGWVGSPDNSNLYNNIDESAASDADYIISPNLATNSSIIMGLSTPMLADTYEISVRGKYISGSGSVRVLLLDGANAVLATSSWQSLTTGYATYILNVVLTSTATRVKVEVSA
jgi:hypothetical protein